MVLPRASGASKLGPSIDRHPQHSSICFSLMFDLFVAVSKYCELYFCWIFQTSFWQVSTYPASHVHTCNQLKVDQIQKHFHKIPNGLYSISRKASEAVKKKRSLDKLTEPFRNTNNVQDHYPSEISNTAK